MHVICFFVEVRIFGNDCTLIINHVNNVLWYFLAHLSLRLRGELIVYRSSRRPCVRPSVHTFKHEYLCNQLADWNEILSEASLGWGKGFSRF